MEQSKYLYFSFQSSQDFDPKSETLNSFQRKYKKDFKTRELFEGEELLNEYRLRGWKHPRYSKIISFIVAFEVEGNIRVKYITGEEKDLLTEFCNILKKSQDYTVVTFDAQIILPYLGIRLTRNGIINAPHIGLKYRGLRPWDMKCVDLQQFYDGAGNYKSSIKDIADDLGLRSGLIIEPEDEFTYYMTNDVSSLKQSAIEKVLIMAEAHRTLLGLEVLIPFMVEESVKDVVEELPKDWLKELYYANQMTNEIREGLKRQIFSGKKPLKKDLENIIKIITAHYQSKGDKVGDKKRKEEEVRAFINSL